MGRIPRKIIELGQTHQIIIFASDDLFQELQATLRRHKFESKITSLGLTVEAILDAATEIIKFCPNISIQVPDLRDVKDNHILALALSAKAEVVITGDRDLLVLENFAGISIVNPIDFLNKYFSA